MIIFLMIYPFSMIRFSTVIAFVFITWSAVAQSGQITINRINQMPDLPQPYVMRDWKDVAVKYDQLVFFGTTGQYFPLRGLRANGINYPSLSPITLQTFVGSSSAQAEGINIIPAIVGATLMGVNKSSQSGFNWVEKTKDFFNRANGQNVYLNNYSAQSGGDWWYDVMPNVFFYQLYSQYPTTSDYSTQFTTVADRWLAAVHAMGGSTNPWNVPNMDYRAFNLMTMTGLASGVREPESAGAIGWILYHAYLGTGEKKYFDGAQLSLEFLNSRTSNPSYELQLPYGAFVAAKMNAEQGTSYDIQKILNWCFDRGPLRGWGSIKGTWDGKDVSGLIGEANDNGNDYAFALNGYQQAAALVPLIKYDKRFTRDLAKWTLNVANASRFFYRTYLTNQDDYDWSLANDPDAVIGYEALKERDSHNGNKRLNGTGDAKRSNWAPTNLGLYGSSSIGYLAAVLDKTDVEGILLLDLNKTDFFTKDSYPSYALYNPHTENKVVTLTLPSGSHDIYDAISEEVIVSNASGTSTVTVKADEAVLLVYVPAGSTLTPEDGKLLANNNVVDHHYGFDFTPKLRIKALTAAATQVTYGQDVEIFLEVENYNTSSTTFEWSDSNGSLGTYPTRVFTWTAPNTEGENTLTVTIASNGETVSESIVFQVLPYVPEPPVVSSISSSEKWQETGSEVVFTSNATDDRDQPAELTYVWTSTGGTITAQSGITATWQAPSVEGIYSITCAVTDSDELTTTLTRQLLVKHASTGETTPLAYYPFDGNVRDYGPNELHATMSGVEATQDVRGENRKAYLFDAGTDMISVPNSPALNFQDKITLSFWVKAGSIPEESFILSHGSWEERWKVSITPTRFLRWTLKTNTGTKDLDGSTPLELNRFYHFTVVYSGYSMEVYVDGELDTFMVNSGLIAPTTKALTMGRKQEGEENYYLRGVVDEVRIYNAIVAPDEINGLKDKWNDVVTGVEDELRKISAYPNPTEGDFFLSGVTLAQTQQMKLYDMRGSALQFQVSQAGSDVRVSINSNVKGLVIVALNAGQQVIHRKIMFR